jgi:hypothetical protein
MKQRVSDSEVGEMIANAGLDEGSWTPRITEGLARDLRDARARIKELDDLFDMQRERVAKTSGRCELNWSTSAVVVSTDTESNAPDVSPSPPPKGWWVMSRRLALGDFDWPFWLAIGLVLLVLIAGSEFSCTYMSAPK